MKSKDVPSLILGVMAKIRERAEDSLDEMIKEGEKRAQDLKDSVLKLREEEEEEKEETGLKKFFAEILEKVGLATEDDLCALEKKIAKVEKKLR